MSVLCAHLAITTKSNRAMASLGFILHSRPYRESSALVDLFLQEQGRMRAVIRSARSAKGSLARPFQQLSLELKGRGDLQNISQLEVAGSYLLLNGTALFCAMYLNELLMRMLALRDPQPVVFEHYSLTLQALANDYAVEPLLRSFEWRLLEQLGYGFSLEHDSDGQQLQAQQWYALVVDEGLQLLPKYLPGAYRGEDLLELAANNWQHPQVLRTAKQLMRQALAPHLGSRPLQSRELFLKQQEPSQ